MLHGSVVECHHHPDPRPDPLIVESGFRTQPQDITERDIHRDRVGAPPTILVTTDPDLSDHLIEGWQALMIGALLLAQDPLIVVEVVDCPLLSICGVDVVP